MKDHPHKHRINKLVEEAIHSAEHINYEHDERNLEWDLDKSSIVFEVGAYRGRWAYQIATRYYPLLWCFEPQVWAWDVCRNVLKDFPFARVLNYGLGRYNGMFLMGNHDTDGATLGTHTGLQKTVEMRDIEWALEDLGVTHIDLMLINIEGFEYTLIPHMFNCGIFPKQLVVQFHDYDGANKEPGMRLLIEKQGYKKLWDYGRVLAAWGME